ncbi:9903_t:CDS:2 [Gigaspora margarita]|uniref:9903_t:CDS:1 n=1 Tax=Gigaspora margarita TaxID=4874 RepID=A0ABN7WIV3_GIGMA|nr:9903_t:CDS:2 [Gigaspora margarita]
MSGDHIDGRVGHSAILIQNGNILIIGGSNDAYGYATVSPALGVLNTNTWMWIIPNPS